MNLNIDVTKTGLQIPLKSIFSEIRIRTPKTQTSDWLIYLFYQFEACFFWRDTTHVLTWITEKTDFRDRTNSSEIKKVGIRGGGLPFSGTQAT